MRETHVNVYCDGGARGNPGPAASAFVVDNAAGQLIYQDAYLLGRATNNVAEYTAVKMALSWMRDNLDSETSIRFYLDSLLVVNQLNGDFKIKNEALVAVAQEIKTIAQDFKRVTYQHIPREKNKRADLLVNQVLDGISFSKRV